MTKMRAAMGGPGSAADARRALGEVQRSRTRLELEPVRSTEPVRLVTTVEQVLIESFLVARPMRGGAVHALGLYEHYRMSFVAAAGRVTGLTQTLGRVRIDAGGGAMLLGYRLALPEDFHVADPRRALMTLIGPDAVPEAELHVLGRYGPFLGVLEDLDPRGARIVCRNAGDHLAPGQNVYFKVTLPGALGAVHEPARVTGLDPMPARRDRVRVHVMFREKNQRIADALRRKRR